MRKGFTLIEILIVLAISAMLSAIAIVYSHEGQNQVSLSVETAKVAEGILTAKNLSIATYATTNTSCGYGALINIASNTYSVFTYEPQSHPPEHGVAPPCPANSIASTSPIYANEMVEYSPANWQVKLASGVKFVNGGAGNNLMIVLFYPPAPTTFISRDGSTFLDPTVVPSVTSKVYLETTDGTDSSTITVNGAGEVDF
jgi:prepilin-type N-terminal cleavage/methylation domain-containing protein